MVYGEKIVYSGPVYDSMQIQGGKIRLSFQYVGGGLTAKGGELKGFTIAGGDRKFVPARAEISGQTVVVWSEGLKDPKAAPMPGPTSPNAHSTTPKVCRPLLSARTTGQE